MKKVKLSEILTESSVLSESPNPDRRIRVRLNVQGIEKRPFENSIEGATNYYIRKAGQFIYGKQNLFKGAFGIIPQELDGFESSSDLPSFDISDICSPTYLLFYFQRGDYYKTLESIAKGGASKRISPKNFLNLEIPLPSLGEQETIVQKIKGFMATHSQAKAKIEALQTDLKAYRKSILQEAIKGNLTAEWRANNPTEKIDLKTHKKETTKKQKPLAAIKVDEMPFTLPQNWSWVRLGEICDFITKGTTPNTNKITPNGEIPYLKVYNIVNQKLNFHYKPQFIDSYTHEKELTRSIVYPDDVLMNIVGPPLGKVAIVTNDYPEWNINQALAIFRPVEIRFNKFLYHYLCEGSEIRKLQPLGVVGQDNISLEQCRNLLFPLPPLTEQAEIVRVLEEKMATIAAAEEQLKALLAEQSQLQKSMMQEVFRG